MSDDLVAFAEERQLLVGSLSLSLPAVVAINQVREGNVMTAAGQVERTRAQGIAHRQRQPDFPKAPVNGVVFSFERSVPSGGNEVEGRVGGQPSFLARLQIAREFDGRQELFASRFRLKGKLQKRGQVAPQVMVSRPQLILITSFFQALELAAGFHCLPQRRLVDLPVKESQQIAVCGSRIQNNLHGLEEHFHSLLGALAELAVTSFKGVATAAAQSGQVLFVHRHHVVEKSLLSVGQKASQHSVACGRRESLERLDIVFSGQLREMLDEERGEAGEINLAHADGFEKEATVKVAEDCGGRSFRRILFEIEQRGSSRSLLDRQQFVHGLTDWLRQPCGNAIKHFLAASRAYGGCQAAERGGRGQDDFPKVQEVFGTLQQLGREHALRRLHSKMIFKAGSRLLIEWLITKVGPDALLLGAFRGGAVG